MKSRREDQRRKVFRSLFRTVCMLALVFFLTGTEAAPCVSVYASDDRGMMDSLLEGALSMFGDERALKDCDFQKIPDQKYTGRAVKPSPVITYLGMRLRRGTDYTVTYENNTRAGTAKCRITGKGKYKGTRTLYFKIVRNTGTSSSQSSQTSAAKSRKFTVRLSTGSCIYNGRARKPSVKVTLAGKSVPSSGYTVSYKNNKNVGKASVTVTGKGKYKGCKGSADFKIELKKAGVSGVKSPARGTVSGTWKKDTQADGYQIQYGTRKNFSGEVKTKTVRGRSASFTIEHLTSGKKYYIRVRSFRKVGSSNWYSEWSPVKSVTVK